MPGHGRTLPGPVVVLLIVIMLADDCNNDNGSDVDNDGDGSGGDNGDGHRDYGDHSCIDDGYVQKLMILIKLYGHDSGNDDQLEEAKKLV